MGTWELPHTPAQKKQLRELLSKPLRVGCDSESRYDDSAEAKLYSLIGDDELFDDLYDLRQSQGPEADCRHTVQKHMLRLSVSLWDS